MSNKFEGLKKELIKAKVKAAEESTGTKLNVKDEDFIIYDLIPLFDLLENLV